MSLHLQLSLPCAVAHGGLFFLGRSVVQDGGKQGHQHMHTCMGAGGWIKFQMVLGMVLVVVGWEV